MNDIERAEAGLKLTVTEVVEQYQNEPRPSVGRAVVLADINAERNRQDEKWGENCDHPDGTGGHNAQMVARLAQSQCDNAGAGVTWKHILCEEYAEAMAEDDRDKLRYELIQTAAVIVSWVEALDRRPK